LQIFTRTKKRKQDVQASLKHTAKQIRNLALFFTRNVSLRLWLDTGLFEREKQLYEEHLRCGNLQSVYWLTYGKGDTKLAEELKSVGRLDRRIHVLAMPPFFSGKWGRLVYSFLMTLIHHRFLRDADVLKTNQIDGSWSAVIAGWLYRKPLIVRTGYTRSLFAQKQANPKLAKRFERIERFAYRNADIAAVASRSDKEYICSKYHIARKRTEVLYNYVNIEVFRPTKARKYTDRIIFVGRLEPQKNLFNLIEAVAECDLALDIYGRGELRDELQSHAISRDARVNFPGVVGHGELPEILNRYRYFVLPSLYEGMPKTLLEAMACGLVCIGADTDGIRELIEDGVNGYLAGGTSVDAIAEAIQRAVKLSDDSVVEEAVKRIRENFSIETVTGKEKELIARIMI